MYNSKSDISTLPPQNMMLIAVFHQLLLVIGDPILLGVFKMGDEVLDNSILRDIFFGHVEYGDLILDGSHVF